MKMQNYVSARFYSPQAAAVPDIEKIDMRVGLIVSAGTLAVQC
jgi:hypothetical protein